MSAIFHMLGSATHQPAWRAFLFKVCLRDPWQGRSSASTSLLSALATALCADGRAHGLPQVLGCEGRDSMWSNKSIHVLLLTAS